MSWISVQCGSMQPHTPFAGTTVPIHGLHHFAWRCRNAEQTRHFYEDLLGLPLVHVIRADHVPSTGEYCPYVHIFFRLGDGSHIAFFDLGDDTAAAALAEHACLGQPHGAARRLAGRAAGGAHAPARRRRRGAGADRPPHHPVDLLLRPERLAPRTDGADRARRRNAAPGRPGRMPTWRHGRRDERAEVGRRRTASGCHRRQTGCRAGEPVRPADAASAHLGRVARAGGDAAVSRRSSCTRPATSWATT